MSKSAANAMNYEQTKSNKKKITKLVSPQITEITLMPTHKILGHLYRKHETGIWITGFWLLAAVLVWEQLV